MGQTDSLLHLYTVNFEFEQIITNSVFIPMVVQNFNKIKP